MVLNVSTGKRERIAKIVQMHANKQLPLEEISAGDIGAAVGFKLIRTGDTLCVENKPLVLENIKFPEPVVNIAIEPKVTADLDKLDQSLAKLVEEDPTLFVHTDENSGQTILAGMGELHLDIILDRLKTRKPLLKQFSIVKSIKNRPVARESLPISSSLWVQPTTVCRDCSLSTK